MLYEQPNDVTSMLAVRGANATAWAMNRRVIGTARDAGAV